MVAKKTASQILLKQRMDVREEFICEVRNSWSGKYKPMLVLGAGVSKPAGLPGWQELVSAMFGYSLINVRHNPQKYGRSKLANDLMPLETEIIDALVEGKIQILSGNNVLETGQYVEEMLDGPCAESWIRNEELKEILTRIIDRGESAMQALSRMSHGDSFCSLSTEKKAEFRKDWAHQDTLQAVAYLLNADHGFKQAITYNYDTYVEEYMCEIYEVANKLIVHVDGWNPCQSDTASIEIFHVHGCVPTKYFRTKPDIMGNEPKESKRIILSEDSYYDVEDKEIYNWMNSVQSNAFNQSTCIFVGFSGEDYNFRRILRQLGKYQNANRPKHYMLVTIKETYESIYKSIENFRGNNAELYAKILLDRVLIAKEEYWGRFGFYPIWVTVEDIPDILLSLVPSTP